MSKPLIILFCPLFLASCLSDRAVAITLITLGVLDALPLSETVEIEIANHTKEALLISYDDSIYGSIAKRKVQAVKAPRNAVIKAIGGKSGISYAILNCSVSGEFYTIEGKSVNKNIAPPKYEDLVDPNEEYEKRRKELEYINRALRG